MIYIALIVLVMGVILVAMGQRGRRRHRRITGTPTSAIAQCPGQGLVEVKGRVLASEFGVHTAPFSGRRGVWVSVEVQEYRSSGKSGSWVSVHKEAHSHPFWIDDGSGQHARLEPVGAELVADTREVAKSGTFHDATPHLQAFLQSRNLSATNFLGMNKSMRYLEFVLAEGDTIYALGSSRRVPGPPVHDGYRMTPSSHLVLFHGLAEEQELIVSTKEESELAAGLRRPFLLGVALTVLSVIGGTVIGIGMLLSLW